jgi:hypothetical protein
VLLPVPVVQTLLLKPVVNQTFLNITAANLPGGDNAYAVPKSYTMIGELVSGPLGRHDQATACMWAP